MNEEIAENQMLDELRIEKKRRDVNINMLAPSQIEKEELGKYMHIMFTHRVLGQIIKSKSLNLIQKYKDVQKAYMYMKSNTNIVELGKILQRMERQDEVYDAALKRV